MSPSLLINASREGNLEMVQQILATGFDPNTRTDNGDVALLAAASKGHYSIIATLLKHGANPNLRSSSSSALSYSVSRRDRDIFYLLLDFPVKPSFEVLCYALETGLREGCSDLVEALLEAGADPGRMVNPIGTLINIVNGGYVKIMKLLLAKGVDFDARDFRGETLLLRLAGGSARADMESTETIEVVLTSLDDPFATDDDGFSALTRAARSGSIKVIQAFARCNHPLDRPDANGLTALEVAIDSGQYDAIKMLLELGANPNVSGDKGISPLIRTVTGVYYQRKEVVELFLRFGADTSLTDADGYTALERANLTRQKGISKLLQQHEPNLFELSVRAAGRGTARTVSHQHTPSSYKPIDVEEKAIVRSKGSSPDKVLPPLQELQGMVGLVQVKAELSQIANFLHIQQLRRQKGLSVPELNHHFVFNGNPGTGKTVTASLTSRIYKHLNVLDKGHLVKTDRAGLITAYLDKTLKRLVQSAIGGVLYIDKAYSLVEQEQGADQYGTDALNACLEFADDYRDNLILIVAGYTEPMQKFIRSNPGLQSRFNKFLHFDDYAPAELTEIFRHFAAQGDYTLHPATELKLTNVFSALYARRDETFGNARLARNLFEKAINAHANRMVSVASPDEASLVTLYPEDIPNA